VIAGPLIGEKRPAIIGRMPIIESEENIMTEPVERKQKKMSFFATLAAVFWSFIGLRRRSDYEKDVTGLNPVYVIIAALIGVAIFIGLLLTIVKLVLK
jgi:hypothetical protein